MLKSLKSIFIVEEESPKKPTPQSASPAKSSPKTTEKVQQPATAPKPTTASDGKVTPKFTDILLGAMEKVNLDGFDYLEYKKSLQSLLKMNAGMDEATAFKSAYAMAQTMGASPTLLVNTAEHYMQALKTEEEKFRLALANQQESKVGNKQKEKQQLQAGIKDKQERILHHKRN
ncbi:MAG: hypothetical protein R2795_16480 [Saprospiraceae bacterium]